MGKKRGRYLTLLINLWIVIAFFLESFADILPRPGFFMKLPGSVKLSKEWRQFICCSILLEKQIADMEKSFWWEQTVYACSLVADRIGYLYEPIFGGGFPETGGLVLTAAFGCVLWRDLSEAYKIRLTYEVYIIRLSFVSLPRKIIMTG